MSIIEKINNSKSEGELLQIIEEQVIDIETSLSWGEEASVLEQNGDQEKADLLRAAEKRWFEIEQETI
jgi:hypothetical protein